jgi:cytochrome o ubiquinol oxidase subunit 1
MQHYAETEWQPLMLVAMAGRAGDPGRHRADRPAALRQHPQPRRLRDRTGDPWNGRTLEWSIASPPPPWNFAVLPQVQGVDAYWA